MQQNRLGELAQQQQQQHNTTGRPGPEILNNISLGNNIELVGLAS